MGLMVAYFLNGMRQGRLRREEGCECMGWAITHELDEMRQVRHIVRQLRNNGFDDHSRSIWDETNTICCETAATAWIRQSCTI